MEGKILQVLLDLNPLIFDCIFEVNNEKIGRWTPGKKIEIVSEQVDLRKADYYLLLAWTQKDIVFSVPSWLRG